MYPISPTALNKTIGQAVKAGIVIMAYDSEVSHPEAYNLTFDQYHAGQRTAEWLAKAMNYEGNYVIIGGVPGTTVDKLRTQAAKDVFIKHPKMKMIAEFWGMWAQGPAEEGMVKVIAAHPKIDGVWAQVGGVGVPKALLDADRPLIPIATESANLWRLHMIDPKMKEAGLSGVSYGSPLYQGAAALQYVVRILDGETDIPKKILIPYDYVEAKDIKLCKTGSTEELEAGCNVYPADIVSPGFFADWYHPEFSKGVDLQMALTGMVPE
jgi:ribose transport system substrate-binding protein